MDYNEIRSLLKKYWAGETDIKEEEILKMFFLTQTDLPKDLKPAKKLFQYYKMQSETPELKEDLTVKVRNVWRKEEQSNNTILLWIRKIKYAAVLILFFIPGYLIIQKNYRQKISTAQMDTFADPKKAIEETEKALMFLSKNMNDGLDKVRSLKAFNDAQKSVIEIKK